MKETLLILFLTLFSTQVLAQKEAQEFPWSRAAKIIAADEAKGTQPKKTELRPKADSEKREKKIDVDNNKKSK